MNPILSYITIWYTLVRLHARKVVCGVIVVSELYVVCSSADGAFFGMKLQKLVIKSQLISKWFFVVFKSSKKLTFLTDFALVFKLGHIKKLKAINYIAW